MLAIAGAINRVASKAIKIVKSTIGVIINIIIRAIKVVNSNIFIIVKGIEEFKAKGI